ncbi:XRE family transcriptional regulator [Frondihabitans cladoniiphilus]
MSETPTQALHEALAAELRAAQAIANVNVRTWAQEAAITHDSIYRVLRGVRPVSVVELVMLCRALEEDPLELISRAAQRAGQPLGGSRKNEMTRVNRARLALEAAGLYEDLDAAFLAARAAASKDGYLLSVGEWDAFLAGTSTAATTSALGIFLEVPGEYLTGREDAASSQIETQLRFARSMHDVGVTRLAARSLEELQPEEIQAVEAAIREFIDEEEGPEK